MKMPGQFIAAAFAAWSLLFAQTVLAQPVPESLGELLVGKAAFGDWRADAPLVRRKITELPPPYTTRSASNPARVVPRPGLRRAEGAAGFPGRTVRLQSPRSAHGSGRSERRHLHRPIRTGTDSGPARRRRSGQA